MVAHCANPGCSTEFRYLHDGKLYVVQSRDHSLPHFVWVCNACSQTMVLTCKNGSAVNVVRRTEAARMQA
jgi:hypothetical protein